MFHAAMTQLTLATGSVLAQITDPGTRTNFPGFDLARTRSDG